MNLIKFIIFYIYKYICMYTYIVCILLLYILRYLYSYRHNIGIIIYNFIRAYKGWILLKIMKNLTKKYIYIYIYIYILIYLSFHITTILCNTFKMIYMCVLFILYLYWKYYLLNLDLIFFQNIDFNEYKFI